MAMLKTPPASGRGSNDTNTKGTTRRCVHGLIILSLGSVLGHSLTLLYQGHVLLEGQQDAFAVEHKSSFMKTANKKYEGAQWVSNRNAKQEEDEGVVTNNRPNSPPVSYPRQPLQDLRILVAIASYDFSQLPHLEETLDGYHEVCIAGVAKLDIIVHTTVVYPVAWLDLYRTRFNCPNFSLTFVIENKNLRLHLVDLHRKLFYDELNNYDLFIYTEDDIRVTPTTVASYWQETQALKEVANIDYTLFNVGVVRYEYNFPSVVINDKTRHAIENVTRVYWEHSIPLAQNKPILPNAAQGLDQLNTDPQANTHYIHMRNHHQGMFLATRAHLQKWKELEKCQFDIVQNRPGFGPHQRQPVLGTQRVWMSSYQLYEPKYCNIQQVLPVERFGALTVHHVPNKNYRRKKGGKTLLEHGNGTAHVGLDQGSKDLIAALQLHLLLAKEYPREPQVPYRGTIQVQDHVSRERNSILEDRLAAWRKYVARGGILSDEDITHTNLIEWEERLAWIEKAAERKRKAEERQRQQGEE